MHTLVSTHRRTKSDTEVGCNDNQYLNVVMPASFLN